MSIRHLALMPPSTKSSAKLVRGTGFNVAWPPWIGAPMVSCSVTWPGYKLKVWAGSGEETSGRKMHKRLENERNCFIRAFAFERGYRLRHRCDCSHRLKHPSTATPNQIFLILYMAEARCYNTRLAYQYNHISCFINSFCYLACSQGSRPWAGIGRDDRCAAQRTPLAAPMSGQGVRIPYL